MAPSDSPEGTAKYDPTVDFTDENLSQPLLAMLVGEGKTVLDVGCATGYLAKMLRERGCRVDGIEYDPVMAELAAPHVDRLEVGDVSAMDLPGLLGEASYDVVVFGDVLEHLVDPLTVLRSSTRLLKPGGSIVISIPNVAHGAVRLALLKGQFRYTSTGLLDETHVRFFTRATVLELVDQAGLAVEEMRRTEAELFQTEVPLAEGDVHAEVVDLVAGDPEARTYQFVLRAVPKEQADPRLVRAVEDAEAARLAAAAAPSLSAGATVELPAVPSARVGVWGAWDVDDLTQAVAGRVVSAELARRLPGVLLRFAAPEGLRAHRTGLGEPVEELGSVGPARRRQLARGLDAVVVVGRVDTDREALAARYARPPRDDEPGLHLVSGPDGVPALWGPVWVDGSAPGHLPAGTALDGAALQPLPEPTLLAPRVLPLADALRRRAFLWSAGWLPRSDRVVAVHLQGGTAVGDVVAELQRLVAADAGVTVVALEVDTSTGDGGPANEVAVALPGRALICPVDAGVEGLLAILATSSAVVSTSPAVRAAARAYGVPAVGPEDVAGLGTLVADGREGLDAVRADQVALDGWFDQVAAAVRDAVAPAEERARLSATERYAAMERAHAVMRARTSSEVLRATESVPALEVVSDAARAQAEIAHLRAELEAHRNTLSFRALDRPRRLYGRVRRRLG